MGMFDNVKCLYPTPWPKSAELEWQTKDTPAQYLDDYEVRMDGTLWHKEYESRIEADPKAPLGVWLHRESEHWVQENMTGQLEIYAGDYTIMFWLRDGKVKDAVFYVANQEEGKGSPC